MYRNDVGMLNSGYRIPNKEFNKQKVVEEKITVLYYPY